MNTVAFNAIPENTLVPFFWAEINSGGSPYEGQSKLVLAMQRTSAGTAPAGTLAGPIQSEREARALFGVGSMAVAAYKIARRNAGLAPIWMLPLADPAGNAAHGTITVNTAPGAANVGVLDICGKRMTFQIGASDAVADIATKIAATVNAAEVPVTAAAATAVVTITARHVGEIGNAILIRVPADEPNGLVGHVTVVAMAGGTGIPDLAAALANLGDDEADFLAAPYTDATSLNTVRGFLDDAAGRWSPYQQLYGHYFSAGFGTLSALVALGDGRNDQHVSIMGSQASPTPPWEWAAALGAVAQAHLTDAPELSRPLQTLKLLGVRPPADRALWWDKPDRQALYQDGISGYTVTVDGQVQIDRVVTTYQEGALGSPDATFRNVETMAQLVFFTRYVRAGVSAKHGRQALADENPAGVAQITTPRDIKATLIHLYEELVGLGVVEKADLFARFVTVVRDPNNADRVNAYLPVDVVNQLRVFAANVTAFLEYREV
ncbi:MAG TPA: phage tail sheath subtilisin-like domain-containing protein [Kaistiaceae bacterium]|nr:phage tail sheath subtilisin-like domain-containing protein [Kaistiaceae bacterium]